MTVVVVGVGIGKLVVVAMEPDPVDRPVLTAQGTTGSKKAFQPTRNSEGAVREQAVVADRHS